MRVLVTWGSKHGGTAGIGRVLANALAAHGFEVVSAPVEEVPSLAGFHAAIVGGAIYANRWTAGARRFVTRHLAELRRMPVWFFSSGPLDDSADRGAFEEPASVAVLAERAGAHGHALFGGRLAPDAKGFPAASMAKKNAGDWRNTDRIRAFADELAVELPRARPGHAVEHPARAISRLVSYGLIGWVVAATVMAAMLELAGMSAALVAHAIVAPVVFAFLAWRYFHARGARAPLPTAAAWTALVLVLDLVILAALAQRSLAMFASVAGTWLPLALVFLVTWSLGVVREMMPTGARPAAAH